MDFFNLGTFFFLSLGITFILCILLVHHFQKRIVAFEQKNDIFTEIANNLIAEVSNVKQKMNMLYMMFQNEHPVQPVVQKINPPLQNIILSKIKEEEDSEDEEEDSEDEEDSENDDEDKEENDDEDEDENKEEDEDKDEDKDEDEDKDKDEDEEEDKDDKDEDEDEEEEDKDKDEDDYKRRKEEIEKNEIYHDFTLTNEKIKVSDDEYDHYYHPSNNFIIEQHNKDQNHLVDIDLCVLNIMPEIHNIINQTNLHHQHINNIPEIFDIQTIDDPIEPEEDTIKHIVITDISSSLDISSLDISTQEFEFKKTNDLETMSETSENTTTTNITDVDELNKNIYRKMTLQSLKSLVISKGISSNPSKLKKQELLKLLQET